MRIIFKFILSNNLDLISVIAFLCLDGLRHYYFLKTKKTVFLAVNAMCSFVSFAAFTDQ